MNPVFRDDGFTLLEVVISVALLAMALGAIFPMFMDAPHRIGVAQQKRIAVAAASSILEERALMRDWINIPSSEGAAIWQRLNGGVEWCVFEVLGEDDVQDTGIPGRALHLRLRMRTEEEHRLLLEYDKIIWVVDS